jgi:hypothetical protein
VVYATSIAAPPELAGATADPATTGADLVVMRPSRREDKKSMSNRIMNASLGALVVMTLLAGSSAAQGAAVGKKQAVKPTDQLVAAEDAVPSDSAPKPKGKGGLFGKAKKLAGNKVVQTLAKTAACTMVPGGQAIAGAIDAASSKSAGGAAEGAAAAATGSSCMPGMGGTGTGGAGMAGGGAASMAAMAGMANMAGAGGMGNPETADVLAGAPDEVAVAGCMGLTLEEYREFTSPTHGENRPMTRAEMKRQQQLGKRIDQRRFQSCLMQQMSQ